MGELHFTFILFQELFRNTILNSEKEVLSLQY